MEHYEDAGRMRDAVAMLRSVIEKQAVVRHGGGDHDAIGLARQGSRAAACVLKVRNGTLVGRRTFFFEDPLGDERREIEELLVQRYSEAAEIPPAIYVRIAPEGKTSVEELLRERRGAKVSITVPGRGHMLRLVELARTNAREALALKSRTREVSDILERLGRALKLSHPPELIECVDISNLSGREAVGSLVSFACGEPDKSRYRIYNIRTLDTPDDYGMMREVISRRFRPEVPLRGSKGEGGRMPPDLLLVDGGKGQLAIAERVLKENGVCVAVAAIAKGEKKGEADKIFIPGRKNPVKFKRGSRELLLLQRIRDEAHRFGINAHRRKRSKAALGS